MVFRNIIFEIKCHESFTLGIKAKKVRLDFKDCGQKNKKMLKKMDENPVLAKLAFDFVVRGL